MKKFNKLKLFLLHLLGSSGQGRMLALSNTYLKQVALANRTHDLDFDKLVRIKRLPTCQKL